jgi:bacteriocin-like protein
MNLELTDEELEQVSGRTITNGTVDCTPHI